MKRFCTAEDTVFTLSIGTDRAQQKNIDPDSESEEFDICSVCTLFDTHPAVFIQDYMYCKIHILCSLF